MQNSQCVMEKSFRFGRDVDKITCGLGTEIRFTTGALKEGTVICKEIQWIKIRPALYNMA